MRPARTASASSLEFAPTTRMATMTKVAALEHAHEAIRVNAICPGPVRSPMSEREGDASVDVTPLRRRAEPAEISSAVAFLASDDAVYVTGAELAVDGGYLAR